MGFAVQNLELDPRVVSSFVVDIIAFALLLDARELQKVTFCLIWILLLLVHAKLELVKPMEDELVFENSVYENLVLVFLYNMHTFVNIVLKSKLYRLARFKVNHKEQIEDFIHFVITE